MEGDQPSPGRYSPFAYSPTVKHNHYADHNSKLLHFASQLLGSQVKEEVAHINGL